MFPILLQAQAQEVSFPLIASAALQAFPLQPAAFLQVLHQTVFLFHSIALT